MQRVACMQGYIIWVVENDDTPVDGVVSSVLVVNLDPDSRYCWDDTAQLLVFLWG